MLTASKNQTAKEGFDANYQAFMRCGTQASVFADRAFLREMGIYEEVESILETSGWKSLLNILCVTVVEDTCEFLASVENKEKYLRYRFRGVYYRASKKVIKRALGYTTSSKAEPDQHSDNEAWEALTWGNKKFRAGRSLGSEIREPKFFYLQRIISNTVVARFNGYQRLGVLDMNVMKGLVYGTKVKFGEIITEHWTRIKPTSKIAAGGMITYYLQRVHGTDPLQGYRVSQPEFFTRAKMIKMRAVREDENGEAEWCYEGFAVAPITEIIPTMEDEEIVGDSEEEVAAQEDAPAEEEPAEQPAVRGRRASAPVRAQDPTRRSARVRSQASRASARPQSSAQAEYPWMDPQAQRRWMFNVERVMEFAASDFAIMNIEPPPEWMPDMPIPSGYRCALKHQMMRTVRMTWMTWKLSQRQTLADHRLSRIRCITLMLSQLKL